jgi:AraC-like DNA-binding protein
MVFRAGRYPATNLPFGVRSAGHYRLIAEAFEKPVKKPFLELFWGVSGHGFFRHRNKVFDLGPSQVFVYFPGDTHDISCKSAPWEYRWLTIDGPINAAIAKNLGFTSTVRNTGPCPVELFVELEHLIADLTPSGERSASAVAYKILTLACEKPVPTEKSKDPVLLGRSKMEINYADPRISVKTISAELSMHRSSFCRMFKSRVGVSPQEYLLSLRTRSAMALLQGTDLDIHKIAVMSGYADPNYFSRAIKRMTGLEPRALRKELRPALFRT